MSDKVNKEYFNETTKVTDNYDDVDSCDDVDNTAYTRLSKDEQECIISYNYGDNKTYASCSIKKLWTKFEKANWKLTRVMNYQDGTPSVKFYESNGMRFSIKNTECKKRVMTDEQKEQMSIRMKKMQESRKKQ